MKRESLMERIQAASGRLGEQLEARQQRLNKDLARVKHAEAKRRGLSVQDPKKSEGRCSAPDCASPAKVKGRCRQHFGTRRRLVPGASLGRKR
jgi:hypothetical protein